MKAYTQLRLTLKGLFRYLRHRKLPAFSGQRCIIIGTGPSLKETLKQDHTILQNEITVGVNTFCLTEAFEQVKPKVYVFADPVYSRADGTDWALKKQRQVLDALKEKTQWPMLVVFALYPNQIALEKEFEDSCIDLHMVNIFPPIHWPWLRNALYRTGLFQPRTKNVMGLSIMTCINMGFKDIYLVGADHSFHREFFVGDDNGLYTKWKHFDGTSRARPMYKQQRQGADTYRIHEVWRGMWCTFRMYDIISEYAKFRGTNVYNATPGSFIDAFPRRLLTKIN